MLTKFHQIWSKGSSEYVQSTILLPFLSKKSFRFSKSFCQNTCFQLADFLLFWINQKRFKMHPLLICLMALRSEIYILGCPRKLSKPWKKNFSKTRKSHFPPDETPAASFHPPCGSSSQKLGPCLKPLKIASRAHY